MTNTKDKRKKNVLLVDDEKLFLKSVTDGLKPYQTTYGFEVLVANNGREAIEIINTHEIDAVITDIRMPEADGFKLISHMINNFPATPVVVMTAFGSQEIEKKVRELGIIRYLEKPIDFDVFLSTIRDVLAIEKKGRIEGITISTFLQMMEMEKITCTLTITTGKKEGVLYLRNGELLEAETPTHKGMDAAIEILTWTDVKIDMKETCSLKEGSIKKSLTSILLDSFRILDERDKTAPALKVPISTTPKPDQPIDDTKTEIPLKAEMEAGTPLLEKKTKDPAVNDTKKFSTPFRKVNIDIPKLNEAIDILTSSIGEALISTDIFFTEDTQPVAGWNSNPAACAVFGQITRKVHESLKELALPKLGKYYILDLEDKRVIILIPMGDFQWRMLIDSSKTQLGMLLNLAIPKAISAFEEALNG